MMICKRVFQFFMMISLVGVYACGGKASQGGSADDRSVVRGPDASSPGGVSPQISVPVFNADSAFAYVQVQTAFGPRVPNTEAHRDCGLWLSETLGRFADTLFVQQARVRAYDGTTLNIKNIIGSFRPELRNRILLCAHWDSRPYADWDPDPANHYEPIDGANDGGSGVGVLIEVARHLQAHQPEMGIDIIFFDAEDYGKHQAARGADEDSWALGSQYWAHNPHVSGYQANFGILLDMVGAANATFKQEGFSMMYAPNIVRKVWQHAHDLGYRQYFLNQEGGFITDDHYYVNTIRNIPTINIIHLDATTPHGFFPHWHTVNDNIDAIDKQTLKAVGQTLLSVIFNKK